MFIDGEVIFSSEGTTQGDPFSMALYAIATLPFVRQLDHYSCAQIWYADDAAVGGELSSLRNWWDHICSSWPAFGYFPNEAKSYLVVKSHHASAATSSFANTGINITTGGCPYLGSFIGSSESLSDFSKKMVSKFVDQVDRLILIAQSQPHSAFCGFTHGLLSKWTFFRTTPHLKHLLQPLEDSTHLRFLPALTGQEVFNDNLRSLISLPARLGGMGIINPLAIAEMQYQSSVTITVPLSNLLLHHSMNPLF